MKTYSRFALLIKKGIRPIWFAGSQKHHILRWVLFILPVFQVFSPFIAVYRRLLFCFNLQMDYSRDLQSILVKYFLSFMFFKRIGGLADASWNYVWCIWSLRTEFWNLGGTKWNVFCGIYWNGKDAFIQTQTAPCVFVFNFFHSVFWTWKLSALLVGGMESFLTYQKRWIAILFSCQINLCGTCLETERSQEACSFFFFIIFYSRLNMHSISLLFFHNSKLKIE